MGNANLSLESDLENSKRIIGRPRSLLGLVQWGLRQGALEAGQGLPLHRVLQARRCQAEGVGDRADGVAARGGGGDRAGGGAPLGGID